jgi:hypothetical protein
MIKGTKVNGAVGQIAERQHRPRVMNGRIYELGEPQSHT